MVDMIMTPKDLGKMQQSVFYCLLTRDSWKHHLLLLDIHPQNNKGKELFSSTESPGLAAWGPCIRCQVMPAATIAPRPHSMALHCAFPEYEPPERKDHVLRNLSEGNTATHTWQVLSKCLVSKCAVAQPCNLFLNLVDSIFGLLGSAKCACNTQLDLAHVIKLQLQWIVLFLHCVTLLVIAFSLYVQDSMSIRYHSVICSMWCYNLLGPFKMSNLVQLSGTTVQLIVSATKDNSAKLHL